LRILKVLSSTGFLDTPGLGAAVVGQIEDPIETEGGGLTVVGLLV